MPSAARIAALCLPLLWALGGCKSEESHAPACADCLGGGASGVISGQQGAGGGGGAAGASSGASGASGEGPCSPLSATVFERNDLLLLQSQPYKAETSLTVLKAGGGGLTVKSVDGAAQLSPVSCVPQWISATPTDPNVLGFVAPSDMSQPTAAFDVVRRDLLDQIVSPFAVGLASGAGHVLVTVTLAAGGKDAVVVTVPGSSVTLYGGATWSKVSTVAFTTQVFVANVPLGDAKVTLTRGATTVTQTVPITDGHVTSFGLAL